MIHRLLMSFWDNICRAVKYWIFNIVAFRALQHGKLLLLEKACNLNQPKDTQKWICHHICIPIWCHHSLLSPPTLSRALPMELELLETAAPSSVSLGFCWMEVGSVHISKITSALPLQLIARIECGSGFNGETKKIRRIRDCLQLSKRSESWMK